MKKTILIALILSCLFLPAALLAQEVFEVDVPGDNIAADNTTRPIGNFIAAMYKYGIGIVGIVATVVMMIGGVIWIMAGGNASRINEAKQWIAAALSGLVLALTSYMILNTINPDLVNFTATTINKPGDVSAVSGCCQTTDQQGQPSCFDSSQVQCDQYSERFEGANVEYTPDNVCNTLGECVNGGSLDSVCREDWPCEPGLQCVQVEPNLYKCTDGNPGSPCATNRDCSCGINEYSVCNTEHKCECKEINEGSEPPGAA